MHVEDSPHPTEQEGPARNLFCPWQELQMPLMSLFVSGILPLLKTAAATSAGKRKIPRLVELSSGGRGLCWPWHVWAPSFYSSAPPHIHSRMDVLRGLTCPPKLHPSSCQGRDEALVFCVSFPLSCLAMDTELPPAVSPSGVKPLPLDCIFWVCFWFGEICGVFSEALDASV